MRNVSQHQTKVQAASIDRDSHKLAFIQPTSCFCTDPTCNKRIHALESVIKNLSDEVDRCWALLNNREDAA